MIQRPRALLSGILAVYTFALAGFLLFTGEAGGESGVEWLYLLPVLTAAAMGLFLSLRRPENAVGSLISLTGAALMTLVAVSTLAAAALFNPVRRRVQEWVDHRFNRSRSDAQRVTGTFTETLQEEVDPDEVVDGWLDVVEDTMQPAAVGVWVKAQSGER